MSKAESMRMILDLAKQADILSDQINNIGELAGIDVNDRMYYFPTLLGRSFLVRKGIEAIAEEMGQELVETEYSKTILVDGIRVVQMKHTKEIKNAETV